MDIESPSPKKNCMNPYMCTNEQIGVGYNKKMRKEKHRTLKDREEMANKNPRKCCVIFTINTIINPIHI